MINAAAAAASPELGATDVGVELRLPGMSVADALIPLIASDLILLVCGPIARAFASARERLQDALHRAVRAPPQLVLLGALWQPESCGIALRAEEASPDADNAPIDDAMTRRRI